MPPRESSGVDGTRVIVPPSDAGRRLDVFLASTVPGLSRSQAQRLIRTGRITLQGRRAKPNTILVEGATVDIAPPAPTPAAPQPEAIPLAILHDDADVVVVDKPAGLVVHPSAGHPRGTLVNALLHHVRDLSGIGGAARPGIVHRLDRGTSGVMVVAKHDRAHRDLAKQFHDRTVTKEYLALVWGRVDKGHVMTSPIGRDPRQRLKMSSRAPRGRAAQTTVVDAEHLDGVSLVRVRIGTGRTHQIRVHLSEAGHPVVGDPLYGGGRRRPSAVPALSRLARPFLHAARLCFRHPVTGEAMSFDAPLPPDLEAMLGALRQVGQRPARVRR